MENSAEPSWVSLKDEELLALRICDLGVRLQGSELDAQIQTLLKSRQAARENKQWKESDNLRDEIKKVGFTVEDTAWGQKIKRLQN